jgi:hypothetical protein
MAPAGFLPGAIPNPSREGVRMRNIWRRSRSIAALSALVVSALLLGSSPGAAVADEEDEAAGHVYVLKTI